MLDEITCNQTFVFFARVSKNYIQNRYLAYQTQIRFCTMSFEYNPGNRSTNMIFFN